MAQDFYDILGVNKSASDADLKAAYRKKAMKYHPDRNPGDKEAETHFKEVNAAYDVLKDPQKRAAYDRLGHAAFTQGGTGGAGAGGNPFGGGFGGFGAGGGHPFEGAGFEDIFEDLMGGIFGGQAGGGATKRSRSSRGADLKYVLDVTLEEVLSGVKKTITYPTTLACESCGGNGAKKGTKPVTCSTCGGAGQVRFQQGFFSMVRPCPDCGGTGQVVKEKCPDCHGVGRKRHTKTLDVTVPVGVDDGTRLRLQGEGEAGVAGGPVGDLYVFLKVKKHGLFERDGDNLLMTVPVGAVDAMLGTEIELPKLGGGRTSVKVPAGTQPGTTLRLRDLGLPGLGRPHDKGDLLVTVQVDIPTKLTKEQKETLEGLRGGLVPSRHQESFFSKLKSFWE